MIVKHMLQYQVRLDGMFQALADPARRAMLARLSEGPASAGELAKPFAMTLTAVVQHIRVLEASGLVASEKVGRTRVCRIEPDSMRAAEDWLTERRTSWERKFDRLGAYLERTKNQKTEDTA